MAKPKEDTAETESEVLTPDAVIPGESTMTFDQIREIVLGGGDEVIMDPAVIEARIFDRMMQATSVEELLRPAEVTKFDDVLGEVLNVTDVHFNESDFEDGLGIYAIMDAEIDGVKRAVSVGARTVCHQLLIMKYKGFLPARVVPHKAEKPTKSGYYPCDLTVAPEPEKAF